MLFGFNDEMKSQMISFYGDKKLSTLNMSGISFTVEKEDLKKFIMDYLKESLQGSLGEKIKRYQEKKEAKDFRGDQPITLRLRDIVNRSDFKKGIIRDCRLQNPDKATHKQIDRLFDSVLDSKDEIELYKDGFMRVKIGRDIFENEEYKKDRLKAFDSDSVTIDSFFTMMESIAASTAAIESCEEQVDEKIGGKSKYRSAEEATKQFLDKPRKELLRLSTAYAVARKYQEHLDSLELAGQEDGAKFKKLSVDDRQRKVLEACKHYHFDAGVTHVILKALGLSDKKQVEYCAGVPHTEYGKGGIAGCGCMGDSQFYNLLGWQRHYDSSEGSKQTHPYIDAKTVCGLTRVSARRPEGELADKKPVIVSQLDCGRLDIDPPILPGSRMFNDILFDGENLDVLRFSIPKSLLISRALLKTVFSEVEEKKPEISDKLGGPEVGIEGSVNIPAGDIHAPAGVGVGVDTESVSLLGKPSIETGSWALANIPASCMDAICQMACFTGNIECLHGCCIDCDPRLKPHSLVGGFFCHGAEDRPRGICSLGGGLDCQNGLHLDLHCLGFLNFFFGCGHEQCSKVDDVVCGGNTCDNAEKFCKPVGECCGGFLKCLGECGQVCEACS